MVFLLLRAFELINIVSGFVESVLWFLVFMSKKENEIAGTVCHPDWLLKKTYLKLRLPVKGTDCLLSVSFITGSKVSNSCGQLIVGAFTL